MINALYKSRIVTNALEKKRKRRLEFMLNKVNVTPQMKMLDIGCGTDGRSVQEYIDPNYIITGIDLYPEEKIKIKHPNFTYFQQDARDMSRFQDNEFDLAISVGMMEHIGHLPDLKKMALEIDRVAKEYVIVVPWRYAIIEPHFKWPFFQLLPTEIQRQLVDKLNLHNLRKKLIKDPLYISKHFLWLTAEQWQHIWPNSKVFVFNFENYVIVKSDNE